MRVASAPLDPIHTQEGAATARDAVLVGQKGLVPVVRCEANGHFGDDAGQDGAQTLVETKRRLALDDFRTGL